MGRPRECSHAERYQDGRCKTCTRKRHAVYAKNRRAAERFRAEREASGQGITLEELLGRPPKPPCDLV